MSFDTEALLNRAEKAKEDGPGAVLEVLNPLIDAQEADANAALALGWILGHNVLPCDDTAHLFGKCLNAHPGDDWLAIKLGESLESARDVDDLNAAPPDAPVFALLLTRLREIALANSDPQCETDILSALATTARLMARQNDTVAERAFTRRVELSPENSDAHYSLGLFFKTRGRFVDGISANRHAIELHPQGGSEAARWNLGICATGAGDGKTAIGVWREMGNKLEIRESGLPEGSYPACKVRLAQRPLAERSADCDNPGLQENIWVERLSPCHGIVRSVLFNPELGTDYGDTVLFDGAPITYHRYGDRQIAVFPHLATLRRGNFGFYDFSATQTESRGIETANDLLDRDTYIYSHTESVRTLCAACLRDETVRHDRHDPQEHAVIHGRIAVGPDIPPASALARIDAACAGLPGARLFSPDLCRAAGQTDRARLEDRRMATLRDL